MPDAGTRWQIKGDYFENCNCDVVCPCLISVNAPLTSMPTQGACEVPTAFHIDTGHFGDVTLDGLNVVAVLRMPGRMAEGNGQIAIYLDERADDRQREALQAIFSGAAGGPLGALAGLIGEVLGVTSVPIHYRSEGNARSAEIPGVGHLAVEALPSMAPDGATWAATGHPFAPTRLAMAVGQPGSTWADYGMAWDNSGKNGHYAPIEWSNA